MTNNNRTVGDDIFAERALWSFGGDVAKNFDVHLSKSVPGYSEGHEIILSLSDFFTTKENSKIVDIGSSTGNLLLKVAQRHKNKNIKFIGIDPINEMCSFARDKVINKNLSIEFICDDFMNIEKMENVSVFISYYTMQFIHTSVRQQYIDKIYNCLDWGGALFLFEKIRSPDARFQDYMNQVYNDFKLRNGFNIEEIYKKSESIRGVLEPFSEKGNIDLFRRAGFKDFMTIYHNICFRGWLLIK